LYTILQKVDEDTGKRQQFVWNLVQKAMMLAVEKYNDLPNLINAPSTESWAVQQAASTARSTWLASKSFKKKSEEKPPGVCPTPPTTPWINYFKYHIEAAMNDAKTTGGTTAERNVQQRVRELQAGVGVGAASHVGTAAANNNMPDIGEELRSLGTTLVEGMNKSSNKLARAMIIRSAATVADAKELLALLDEE
jgi:hypothetical protein